MRSVNILGKFYNPMVKKVKSEECSATGHCTNHLFELKPLPNKHGLYFNRLQKAKLCPQHNKKTNSFNRAMPQMNRDHKYYTPSFILESEVQFFSQHDNRMLKDHEQKIKNQKEGATDSILTQWMPKHGRKSKYCTVCELTYADYLQHIKSVSHKERINKSKFTGLIKLMAEGYAEARRVQACLKNLEETEEVVKKVSVWDNASGNSSQEGLRIEDYQDIDKYLLPFTIIERQHL